MGVEEEVDEGPLEPGSVPFQAVESAARNLDSSVEVDDPEILCDLEMLFGCEIELPLPAGLVDDDVLGVVLSEGHIGGGDVGDVENAFRTDALELGHLLALGHLGDLERDLIAGLPETVVVVGERPPLPVRLQEPVENRLVLVPVPKHGPDHVRL